MKFYDYDIVQCRWCYKNIPRQDAKLSQSDEDKPEHYELNPRNEKDVYFDENGKRLWVYCSDCDKEIIEANRDDFSIE